MKNGQDYQDQQKLIFFTTDTTFDKMDSIRSLFDRDEIKRDIQNE